MHTYVLTLILLWESLSAGLGTLGISEGLWIVTFIPNDIFCCDSAMRDILAFTHYTRSLHGAQFMCGVNTALPPTASMKVGSKQDGGNNSKGIY